MTGEFRRSDGPYGRAGKATPVRDLAEDLGTGAARAEDRRDSDGERNGAEVISESSREPRLEFELELGSNNKLSKSASRGRIRKLEKTR